MRKLSAILSIVFVFSFVLMGCSNTEVNESKGSEKADSGDTTQETVFSLENTDSSKNEIEAESKTKNTAQQTNRMVIYNGTISILVKNYQKVENSIEEKATKLGGYVVESTIYNNGEDRISGYMTVKVPQKSFQAFIHDVEKTSIKMTEKTISGNDVTEEYVDLESRLKAKNAVEKRLLSLMEQATKTEDLLKISDDLATVQEEKEQIMGRMNYIQTNVDYSTVTINLEEEIVEVGKIDKQGNRNTWEKAKSLFVDTVNGVITFFSSIVIFLIGLSPVLLPLGIIVVIWFILWRRKKRNE